MTEEIKKEIENVKRIIQDTMKDKYLEFYSEYKQLGGISSKPEFKNHLKRFFELTLNAYVYGSALNLDGTYNQSRLEVWNMWEDYIGNNFEADLYMQAVDNISAYT